MPTATLNVENSPVAVENSANSHIANGATKKPKKDKQTEPLAPPVDPAADMAWSTRKLLQWFDFRRGGTLISKYKLQQAAGCAKGLAEQFTEAQVRDAVTKMENDPYWIANGFDICNVANNIHKYLKPQNGTILATNGHARAASPNTTYTPPVTLDVERNERNRQAMHEKAAKNRAEREAKQASIAK